MLCGREQEIEVIIDHCRTGRLAVLTASPGLGATALLESGLIPALRNDGWITTGFREWQGKSFATDLREAIAGAVREESDDSFFTQAETLEEMLHRMRKRTRRGVVVLLDQFEDYLRCHAGTDVSDAFDADLSRAIAGRECQFVIALQDHAVGAFRRLEQYVPNLMGYRVTLKPLDSAVARLAVDRMGAERGVSFDPAVTEALLSAAPVAFEGGVHPFFLVAGVKRLLDACFERRLDQVTPAMLHAYGGAERLIMESMDSAVEKLNTTHIELFFRWSNILISPDGQRLSVTKEGLTDYSGKFNRFVPALLTQLAEEGILRTVDAGDIRRYEFARDCFTPILRDWRDRREAAMLARSRAQFRVRSIWVAVCSILLIFAVWLVLTIRK